MTKHRHSKVIEAWANGRKVEWFSPSSLEWIPHTQTPDHPLIFNPHVEWRIAKDLADIIDSRGYIPSVVTISSSEWRRCEPTRAYLMLRADKYDSASILKDLADQLDIDLDHQRVRFFYNIQDTIVFGVGDEYSNLWFFTIQLDFGMTHQERNALELHG